MVESARINNHAGLIWAIADLLRGDYKQSEYGRVILPLVVLRRLDCVLELEDAQLVAQARANPIENFRLVFNDAFMKGIVDRMDDNADIFRRILDDRDFQSVAMEHYLGRVFDQARMPR